MSPNSPLGAFLRALITALFAILLPLSLAHAQTDPQGRVLGPITVLENNALFLALDDTRLVGFNTNRVVSIVDVATGEVLDEIEDRRVVVSPDGRLMATYGNDGELELRDIASGAVLLDLSDTAGNRTRRPVFSHDGALVMAGFANSRTILVEVATGALVGDYRLNQDVDIFAPVGLSADGRYVVTTDTGLFLVWDRESGEIVRQHPTPSGWDHGVLDGRGNLVVISQGQEHLDIVPLDPGAEVRQVPLSGDEYSRIHLNADATLAVLRHNRALAVVDLVAEELLYDVGPRAATEAKSIAFSPDGSLLAIGRSYRSVILLDARTGAFRGHHRPHPASNVIALGFTQDGTQIVSGAPRDTRIWPVSTALAALPPTEPQMCVDADVQGSFSASVTFTPEGVVFADRSRTLQSLSLETSEVTPFFDGFDRSVHGIGLSADGSVLFAELTNNAIEVRAMDTGARISLMGPHPERLRDVVFTADGSRAMSVDGDGIAAIWDVAAGDELTVFNRPEFPISAVALSPDGQMGVVGTGTTLALYTTEDATFSHSFSFDDVAGTIRHLHYLKDGQLLVAFADGPLRIIDAMEGTIHAAYDLELEYRVDFIEVSPNGTQLIHDDSEFVVLRDLRTGAEVHRFEHDITVETATFDARGDHLLSAGGDSTMRLWDVATGAELARYVAHRGIVDEVAFLPEGAGVLSAGLDDLLCIYALP
ncbi:WD40 repeat domain-containing protein [Gymnodinialimonas sp.]